MKAELLNPFLIQTVDEMVITNEITLLVQKLALDQGQDRLELLSRNILIYSELLYLIGECIARKKLSYEQLKTTIRITENKYCYKARKEYLEQNNEKPPAMSYFEALATEFVKEDLIKLAKLSSELTRFKNAYDSYDHKINALKKQLEIVKYQDNLGVAYGN